VLIHHRPDLILSTGAGVAVPFLILGKLLSRRIVVVEPITRIETLSLSARLALPFLDVLYVHWPQLQARYPRRRTDRGRLRSGGRPGPGGGAMIVVTVGTEKFPFDRLMHWIEELMEADLLGEEVVVQ
jgi:UDP-N-acetylglucosamine:LPS N-acetylglucosamine transferase